jgi:hypothetical protein
MRTLIQETILGKYTITEIIKEDIKTDEGNMMIIDDDLEIKYKNLILGKLRGFYLIKTT